MCDLVEKYARDHADEYAEERSICSVIKVLTKRNVPKNEIVDEIVEQFNVTKEDAESYYDDFFAVK